MLMRKLIYSFKMILSVIKWKERDGAVSDSQRKMRGDVSLSLAGNSTSVGTDIETLPRLYSI